MFSSTTLPPASARVVVSLLVPPVVAAILATVLANLIGRGPSNEGGLSLFWMVLGVSSWFMGQAWYGLAGMGLRGKRPLLSSAGFAVLGWVGLVLVRIWFIETQEQFATALAADFFYLLLFEAFVMHLWVFGLFFRSVADWRGPLTAAVSSGVLFAIFASFLFQEALFNQYTNGFTAFLYFLAWGLFYGFIRLRTGSILGMAFVQAMQSLTAWYILIPQIPPSQPASFGSLYVGMGIVYMILVWRLWPTEESDYRV